VAIRQTLPPYLVRQIESDLRRDAYVMRDVFESELRTQNTTLADINRLSHDLAKETGLRVTVIARDGTVIGESDKPESDLKNIENHLARPEVQQALHEGIGSATRKSDTIGVNLLYVALPVRKDKVVGVVRVALPLVEIQQITARVLHTVGLSSLAVGVAAIPILYWLSRRATRPILQMQKAAGRMTHGDFSEKAPYRASGELGELATALNQMSSQLEAHIRELSEEKADLSAILAGMTEGVLVARTDGRIRLTNQALRHQFGITEETIGKTVLEAFRNVSLQELVGEVIHARTS
jgi:two-component system phosphate regulon sensor histidine kinase PhoR